MRTLAAIFLTLTLYSLSHADGVGRRYNITDIENPETGEENAFAINENLDDLWREKVDNTTTTATLGRRFTILDLSDPDLAEDNTFAIQENLDDLWREKEDLNPPNSEAKYTFDLTDRETTEESEFALNQNIDDLWQEKQ